MTEDERTEVEEDREEDLELDEKADEIRGGTLPGAKKWGDVQLKKGITTDSVPPNG
jgi:hypothetical protein